MTEAAAQRSKAKGLRTALQQCGASLQLQLDTAQALRRRLEAASAELAAARQRSATLEADIARSAPGWDRDDVHCEL